MKVSFRNDRAIRNENNMNKLKQYMRNRRRHKECKILLNFIYNYELNFEFTGAALSAGNLEGDIFSYAEYHRGATRLLKKMREDVTEKYADISKSSNKVSPAPGIFNSEGREQ